MAEEAAARPGVRPRASDAARALLGVGSGALGLGVADRLLPGLGIDGWPELLAASVVLVVVGAVLRPVLVLVAALLGWLGAVLLALLGQAVVVWVALTLVPGDTPPTFWSAFGAGWVVSLVATVVAYLATAGTDEAVTAGLLRRARRSPARVADPDVPGVVFVQIDGAPYPVLRWSITAGTLPTLSRWVRSGSHRLTEWRPALPATTPASQMGILHGTIDGIPGFRWLDRRTGDLLVANRPADAGAHRGAALGRAGPARRRRGLGEQPLHRRRPDGIRDHERGGAHPGEPSGTRGGVGLPGPAGGAGPGADPHGDRGGARAVAAGARPPPGHPPEGAPAVGVRARAGRAHRRHARPDHLARRRLDAPRRAGRLRRLRRLRRRGAPRRAGAPRGAVRPRGDRPGAGAAGAGGDGRAPALPPRRALRPRSVAGRGVRRPLRRGPLRRGPAAEPRRRRGGAAQHRGLGVTGLRPRRCGGRHARRAGRRRGLAPARRAVARRGGGGGAGGRRHR